MLVRKATFDQINFLFGNFSVFKRFLKPLIMQKTRKIKTSSSNHSSSYVLWRILWKLSKTVRLSLRKY